MPTASLIKFPVMVEAYRQAEEDGLDLAEMVTLHDDDKVPGSGILTVHFSEGATFSLRDAIRLMIAYSDNTATNLVLDEIGLKSTAETMEEMGFPETKIHSKVYRRDTSVFPERSPKYGLGSTTADDMVALLKRLHARELISRGRVGGDVRPPPPLRGRQALQAVPARGDPGRPQDRGRQRGEDLGRRHRDARRAGGALRPDERERGHELGRPQRRRAADRRGRPRGLQPLQPLADRRRTRRGRRGPAAEGRRRRPGGRVAPAAAQRLARPLARPLGRRRLRAGDRVGAPAVPGADGHPGDRRRRRADPRGARARAGAGRRTGGAVARAGQCRGAADRAGRSPRRAALRHGQGVGRARRRLGGRRRRPPRGRAARHGEHDEGDDGDGRPSARRGGPRRARRGRHLHRPRRPDDRLDLGPPGRRAGDGPRAALRPAPALGQRRLGRAGRALRGQARPVGGRSGRDRPARPVRRGHEPDGRGTEPRAVALREYPRPDRRRAQGERPRPRPARLRSRWTTRSSPRSSRLGSTAPGSSISRTRAGTSSGRTRISCCRSRGSTASRPAPPTPPAPA